MTGSPQTLYDKIFNSHIVEKGEDGVNILYIDRHLVHEVTSPQAFEGLREAGRTVRAPERTLVLADHNIPTKDRHLGIVEEESRIQVETLEANVKEFGLEYFPMSDIRAGIVHVAGPEQGFTLPGQTMVCGDSHTSTHGAFGTLAFGIGTSEVEHVLATQTLLSPVSKNMRVNIDGKLPLGVTAKDVALAVIGKLGTAGGTGYVIEYAGETVRDFTMEERMTLCNLTIEAGARAGLIAPDDTTATLRERLARLGADLLVETLPRWLAGEIVAQPQDDSQATYCRTIAKADGQLDWQLPAEELERQVRAYIPWPTAFTTWQGRQLKVLRAAPHRTLCPWATGPGAGHGTVHRTGHGTVLKAGVCQSGLGRLEPGDSY